VDFKGLLHASAFPVPPVAPCCRGDAALRGSGTVSERTRSGRDLGESRQKLLEFVFLAEGERAVAPEAWPSRGLLSQPGWGARGAEGTGTTRLGVVQVDLFKFWFKTAENMRSPSFFGPLF